MISKTTLLEVVSGRRRGVMASVLRCLLWLLALIYRLVIGYRNRKFDRAAAADDRSVIRRVQVPVVCVGNLTTGGTGKTPLVIALSRRLRKLQRRVAVVSRGYGGDLDASGVNDEALEIEHRLPGVPHVQGADRFLATSIAVNELEAQIIVLDDGFQHRQLHRDLDIVVIDATNPFGYDHLLPRGLLREPVSSLVRAGLVIVTRCNLVSRHQQDRIIQRISDYIARDQVLLASMKITAAIQASGKTHSLVELQQKITYLFSGIGNPKGFAQSLADDRWAIVGHDISNDHYHFDREDIDRIGRLAQQSGAQQIVCTHKDLVKIGVDQIAGLPVYAVLITAQFDDGEQVLDQALQKLLNKY